MTNAFQKNLGFQNNAFQAFIISGDKHDGFNREHWKRYRKKIERAAKAAEKYQQSKYIQHAIEIAEIAEDSNIVSPIIFKISNAIRNNEIINIDFSSLQKELVMVSDQLNKIIKEEIFETEADDDIIMLLLLQ